VEEIDGKGGRRGSGSGEASGSARAGEERGGSGAGGLGDGARLLYRAEGQAGGVGDSPRGPLKQRGNPHLNPGIKTR
jgi:hypothetical protein